MNDEESEMLAERISVRKGRDLWLMSAADYAGLRKS